MFETLFSERGLSLDRLKVLIEVRDAGSIAQAAPADPVRQSQYSRQLRELSEFFGCDETPEAVLAELQRLALLRSARLIADEAWVGLAAPGDGGGFLWDDGRAESTRPPLWGVSEPRRAEGRAVVLIVPPTAVTDISVQLARVVDERERRPYLCQY